MTPVIGERFFAPQKSAAKRISIRLETALKRLDSATLADPKAESTSLREIPSSPLDHV